jgi:putative polyhydroxyalkanoate system protein
MADIEIHRKHKLGLAKAKAVANKVAHDLAQKYDLQSEWDGNTLSFSRTGISGQLCISKDSMDCEVSLGFLFKAFKGPIQGEMEKNFDKLLKA